MIGERIRTLRKQLGLTQKEFAKKIGVIDRLVSKWEKGLNDPTTKSLKAIAKTFNVNLHWLLTGEGEMFINKEGHSGIPSDRANIHPELYNFLALLPEEQQKQLASVFKEVLKSSSALSSGHTSPLQQERQAEGGRIAEEE